MMPAKTNDAPVTDDEAGFADDDDAEYREHQDCERRRKNREEHLRRDLALDATGLYRGQEVPAEILAEMRSRRLTYLKNALRNPAYSDHDDLVPALHFRYTGPLKTGPGEPKLGWLVHECGSVTLAPRRPASARDFEMYFATGHHLDPKGNCRSLEEIARALGTKPLKLTRWLQYYDPALCAAIPWVIGR
jgi:hypothetical protein